MSALTWTTRLMGRAAATNGRKFPWLDIPTITTSSVTFLSALTTAEARSSLGVSEPLTELCTSIDGKPRFSNSAVMGALIY